MRQKTYKPLIGKIFHSSELFYVASLFTESLAPL